MLTCIDSATGEADGTAEVAVYQTRPLERDEKVCDFCGRPKSRCHKLVMSTITDKRICDACIKVCGTLAGKYLTR